MEQPRLLASPRFRRRLVKGGVLLAVVGAGVVVSILFWNTADPPPTPLHGLAQTYVEPLPVEFSAAEKQEMISTAERFVKTAVRREHSELAYELVGPDLRAGTTRKSWVEGEIPVVPYPVEAARWKFDYSFEDEIGLQVVVFPDEGSELRPMIFNMSLTAVNDAAGRHWLVNSWTPRGLGGGRKTRTQGSPFDIGAAVRANRGPKSRLGAEWLLVPVALVGLAVLLPAAAIAVGRVRSRRAQRAYDASLR